MFVKSGNTARQDKKVLAAVVAIGSFVLFTGAVAHGGPTGGGKGSTSNEYSFHADGSQIGSAPVKPAYACKGRHWIAYTCPPHFPKGATCWKCIE